MNSRVSTIRAFFFLLFCLSGCWGYFVKGEGIMLGMKKDFLPLAALTLLPWQLMVSARREEFTAERPYIRLL